ncbi:MAG TPA: amidohydrolase family protein, partial [Chloroflexota bacterium]|nr:amidohydrolase family protein [Chloroflexota bacterium]
ERDVGIAHNPSSNLRLRSGIASVPEFLAAGISLGIGLDGHTLDDDQDYLRELRLAWTLANRPGAESATVPASAIWSLGTTGGAAITLGKEIRLGKLEAGYLADLVLIDRGSGLDDWTIGLSAQASPDATLAYLPELMLRSASHQNVRDVMVNGEWVLRDRHSTKLDETTLVSELRQNLAVAAKSGGAAANPTRTIAPYVRQYYAGWDRDSDEPSEPRKPTGDSKW